MIHYHGLPITPASVAYRAIRARHACVSFQYPAQVEIAAEACQSFILDNGAFSAWRAGNPIADWCQYYQWAKKWARHPSCDFALIPDSIDGGESDNDRLVDEWPLGEVGVPVYHIHESLDRARELSVSWPRIAIGSSGEFSDIGTEAWWARMSKVMGAVCDGSGLPNCKLHGLRMLNPAVFRRLPLSSADSTNVARNIGLDVHWRGPYLPKSRASRAMVLTERIEEWNSAAIWREHHEQADWLSAFSVP